MECQAAENAERLLDNMKFDRSDGGLSELVVRVSMGARILPNNFSQDVAYLAFIIHTQREEIERLKRPL